MPLSTVTILVQKPYVSLLIFIPYSQKLNVEHPKLIGDRKFLIVMIAIAVTLLIDTSFVKINDLIDKYLIPMESKLILFSVNSSICLLLQFIIIKYVMHSFGRRELRNIPKVRALYIISLTSFMALAVLVGLIMFQLFYYDFYDTWINILIVSISYGTSALLLIRLSLFFFHWYKSNHDLIVLLYFISMSLIVFNLIFTALFVDFKTNRYTIPCSRICWWGNGCI